MEQNYFDISLLLLAETSSPAFENNLSVRTDMLRVLTYFWKVIVTVVDKRYHFANHVKVLASRYRVSHISTHF